MAREAWSQPLAYALVPFAVFAMILFRQVIRTAHCPDCRARLPTDLAVPQEIPDVVGRRVPLLQVRL